MDERVREHAAVLVDWSARVEPGDDVVVTGNSAAHDLLVALAEKLGSVGANPVTLYADSEVGRAYLRAHDGDFDEDPAHELALYENADAVFLIRATRNSAATADVPGPIRQAAARASRGVSQARRDTDWVLTCHPTRALAQQAGMAFEAYQDFCYDAILRDWEALAEEMAEMKAILDEGDTVRLVKDRTDLTMSTADRTAVNSAASVTYDSHNLPSGEVFTAPYDTEGTVFFDVPMTVNGRAVRDVSLTFEAGDLVDYSADRGEDAIRDVVETDDGAKRLGELGIGMNRGIDRITDNVLFDEKMGDTVHLALGAAYDANLPDGESGNESAVHTDLITDMSEDARIEVDGEVVQRNGRYRWEDGFEG